MTPGRYGPLAYLPITRRPKLTWPDGVRVALWVNPNIEFFGLDDVMPGNLNERVPREHARIPNVRNWAVRDYGNRVGIWRIMEVLTRYGIRASAALTAKCAIITRRSSKRPAGSAGSWSATIRPTRCG